MPFILGINGYRRYTNAEQGKLQLAKYYRQHNKVRSACQIDAFVQRNNERLYNIQQGDVWGTWILDQIAPTGRGMAQRDIGFSYHDEVKYEGKSDFLKDFYKGGRQRVPQM